MVGKKKGGGGGGRAYGTHAPTMRAVSSNKSSKGNKSKGAQRHSSSSGAPSRSHTRPSSKRALNAYALDSDEDTPEQNTQRYDEDAMQSREYRLPDNFEDEELDSDEEGIFNEEDEEKYGDVFASRDRNRKARGGRRTASTTEGEEDSDEMDDGDEEEDDEDLSGFEGAQTMSLSDMLGGDDSHDAEEEEEEEGEDEYDEEDEMDEEEDEEEEDDDDAEQVEEDEDEDALSVEDDDEEDVADGGDAHKSLLDFVQSLRTDGAAAGDDAKVLGKEKKKGKKSALEEHDEAFEEDPFNLPKASTTATTTAAAVPSGGLRLGDLLKKMSRASDGTSSSSATTGVSGEFATLKKKLQSLTTSQHTKTLIEPLPEIRQEELTRIKAYQDARHEVQRWTPLINRNRDATTLTFPLNQPGRMHLSSAQLNTQFKPSNEHTLEADLDQLMKNYALKENKVKEMEERELQQQQLTPEELSKRSDHLARMKSLLFHHELKVRRMNKIKSKAYRRMKKRAKLKQMEATLEEMKELDPQAYEEEQRKQEMKRIEERMTLQHSNQSKWMAKQLRLNKDTGNTNKDIQEVLRENATIKERLRQKMESFPKQRNSDGETESSDSEEEEEDEEDEDALDENGQLKAKQHPPSESRGAQLRAQLRALEASLGATDESNAEPATGFDLPPGTKKSNQTLGADGEGSLPKTGLFGLKFMQKALERKREETRQLIRETEKELEIEERRTEIIRARRKQGLEELDEEELDAIIDAEYNDGQTVDHGVDPTTAALQARGRKRVDAKKVASTQLVTGVNETQVRLLPNSLQQSSRASGKKTRVDGPIQVTIQKKASTTTVIEEDKKRDEQQQEEPLFEVEAFSDEEEGADETTANGNAQSKKQQPAINKIKQDARAAAQSSVKQTQQNGKAKSKPKDKPSTVAPTVGVAGGKDGVDDNDYGDEEESNPWAQASAANPRKAMRSESTTHPTKKQKTNKNAAQPTSNGAVSIGENEGDDADDADLAVDVDGDVNLLDVDLSAPVRLRAKATAFDLSGSSGGQNGNQAQLVAQAFSNMDDDADGEGVEGNEAEFERLKRQIMEGDLPKEETPVTGLPGWGSWAGAGASNFKSAKQLAREDAEAKKKAEARAALLAKRRDAKLSHVVLSERVDKHALKYQVATLPYPFTSIEQYEKSLAAPIGTEWNTTRAFQEKVQPKVITKPGEIIQPLQFNPKFARKDKASKISGGGGGGGGAKTGASTSNGSSGGRKRKR